MRFLPGDSRGKRRGKFLVMTALLLPVLLGSAALSVDLGVLWSVQAKLTTVADAAALAGAGPLAQGQSTSSASSAASAIAAANALTAFGQSSTAAINIPPVSPSAFAGQSNCVQAVIQFQQPALFSAIWGNQTLPITVRAVAQVVAAPYSSDAVLLLAPSGTALTLSGASQLIGVDGGITVNSTSASSVVSSGSPTINAPSLNLAGGITYSGINPDQAAVTNYDQPGTPDPLANLAEPSPSGMPTQSNSAVNVTGSSSRTLSPGIYTGGINVSGAASVTLDPGVYYVNGGGLTVTGSGSITGDGVFIYNTGGGAFNLSGAGIISLSPMTTGAYAGITLFQDRSDSTAATLSGGSNMNNSGTFYLPDAKLTVSGGSGVGVVGSQFIAKSLSFSGSGELNVQYNSTSVASNYIVKLVE